MQVMEVEETLAQRLRDASGRVVLCDSHRHFVGEVRRGARRVLYVPPLIIHF